MANKSEVDGIVYDTIGGSTTPQPGIIAGRKFKIHGQTANTSASNVANQQAGTVSIPSGTTDGANVTITNTLITTVSLIELQVKGDSGKKLILDKIVYSAGSATFRVQTVDAAATTAACDVHYIIWN